MDGGRQGHFERQYMLDAIPVFPGQHAPCLLLPAKLLVWVQGEPLGTRWFTGR